MKSLNYIIAIFAFCACSSIDCSIDSQVSCDYVFQNSDGKDSTLATSLTVSTTRLTSDGNDTVLINQQTSASTISLPMGYDTDSDKLYFAIDKSDTLQSFAGEDSVVTNSIIDTVIVSKSNSPTFESVDCTPRFNHTLKGVQSTHNFIDTVIINNVKVTKDASKKNLIIRLRNNN